MKLPRIFYGRIADLSNPRLNVALIVVVMAVVAVVFFIRCHEHVNSADELIYEYVWEKDDPTHLWEDGHRFERKVSNLSDIIQTQTKHYFKVNGRSLVHAAEQAFTGHMLLFSFINTAVFILFIFLIINYATASHRKNFPLWMFVLVCILLLFPFQGSLWTSVNYGLNYLWPATMATGMLIIWRLVENGRIKKAWMAPVGLFSMVFGWTHEAFVVPIAGATFLYYCFNFKKYRGAAIAFTIPFWITATIMVFAPGNLIRFFGDELQPSGGIMQKLTNGFFNITRLTVLWILVAVVIIDLVRRKRDSLRSFTAANGRLLLVFALAVMFSMLASTAPYSFAFVELTALLVLLRLLCAGNFFERKWAYRAAIVMAALFIPQQIILARDTITNFKLQQRLLDEYIKSPDGIVKAEYPDIAWTSARYIRLWTHRTPVLYLSAYQLVLSKDKPFLFIEKADAAAFERPEDFFVPANRVAGNAPVYGDADGYYMWAMPDSIRPGTRFIAHVRPVDWNHDVMVPVRIKFALFPDGYPDTEVLRMDTVRSHLCTLYRIKYPPVRKVAYIDTICK